MLPRVLIELRRFLMTRQPGQGRLPPDLELWCKFVPLRHGSQPDALGNRLAVGNIELTGIIVSMELGMPLGVLKVDAEGQI